ncbi:MAG: type I restriction endonuclease subunit R [Chloroflexi bacterium]|nr:type I restriction endonuclease subunit R [Chloroflexota bacterium]
MSSPFSEDHLIEQPTLELFRELGWQTTNGYHEFDSAPGAAGRSPLGRETAADVVLLPRLRQSLEKLNPGLPPEAVDLAIEELTRGRGTLSLAAANRELYRLIKDGVTVRLGADGAAGPGSRPETTITVRVVAWDEPENNDWLIVSQFWVLGELYTCRPDLVGFVNGLPLLLIELKAPGKGAAAAYKDNIRHYKEAIPQLLWYNALILATDGDSSRCGTLTADWERYYDWKRINDEGEKGVISWETMVRGLCAPARWLDLMENFILYDENQGGLAKIAAMNHQYLGTNNALRALRSLGENQGRLGVYWHTQGAGKSYSMIFFAQKALRKLGGNYTFVIVTDRVELDGQIYDNFANCGAVTEKEAHADSGRELQQLLRESHRYVFTLVQKFHTAKGEVYPVLSTRSDIVVMTDEAHRSQYDLFALNMRTALPNAAFIGFTGTPLMVGEERTRQVFGEYVSVYNFSRSIEDKATLPLYYENRIPELQLANEQLGDELEEVLEAAELDDAQEQRLEREFAREYHLITREDRLERIARDIVQHYMHRDFDSAAGPGKAMVVAIDKATAVKMYDKVQRHWREHLADLQKQAQRAHGPARAQIEERIAFMQGTDMAVVVSPTQNEIADLRQKGVDIVPHRRRMSTANPKLDDQFKDPTNPFRIVFVCAMWMTGFDVPSCATIYLDKPMRNHTLMQTIARANRVFKDKVNGLIVDYIGVFRDLQRALAIYAPTPEDSARPIQSKAALVAELREALGEATAFCLGRGVVLARLLAANAFSQVALIEQATQSIVLQEGVVLPDSLEDGVEKLLINDENKRRYLALADRVWSLFGAIKPDPAVNEFLPACTLLRIMADKIRLLQRTTEVPDLLGQVEQVLDQSILVADEEPTYHAGKPIDLSKIDFDALRTRFEQSRQRTEAEKLRGFVNAKLQQMVRLNRTRADLQEAFQRLVDQYNSGASDVEEFFARLVTFAQGLQEEDRRAIGENLSEEELVLFDLLTKPEIQMTKAEREQVKKAAKDLLETLKREKLVLDWRKKQQTMAAVRQTIEEALDRGLPKAYDQPLYQAKCQQLYLHFYESYAGEGKSIYAMAA